jgi:hypothetical protein
MSELNFNIWCVTHDCAVITPSPEADDTFAIPSTAKVEYGRSWGDRVEMTDSEAEFTIDTDILYCLTSGTHHNFVLKVPGNKVLIGDPDE